MKLSIVIPVYNEEKNIEEVIRRVKKAKLPIQREIIAVDDCSADKSFEKLKKIKGIKILRHEKNRGKGAAIRTAIGQAKGDWVIIQDADLEVNPNEIAKLVKFKLTNKFDVVYGSRMLNKENAHSSFTNYLANIFLSKFTNLLYGTELTDMETCYKLIPSKIIREINFKANRFDMEPEITAKISRRGYSIGETSISYKPRSRAGGKKIGWKDGFVALWTLIKCRFKD